MERLIYLIVLVALLTGCADASEVTECVTFEPYGFFGGLWHGMITPLSFIGSLFFDGIEVYAVNNTGGWYDFGFLLGVGGLSFGTSKGSKAVSKN